MRARVRHDEDAGASRERRVVRAVGFVPVEAKLRLPDPDESLVVRGEVIDRLLEAGHAHVVLITAPPGYGKTVVARQWASADPRPFAWLTLDTTDNDPAVLLTYLMLALQRVEPVDAGILAQLAEDGDAIGEVALPRLGRMLRHRRQPFVLLMDEADALTAPAAVEVLETLATHMPAGSQLALVARSAPPLDWSSLRAHRQLFELGASDLRLSEAEATALIELAGLDLTKDELSQIVERSEGWAAAIYLAATSLASSARRTPADHVLLGNNSIIAGYLRDHMLTGLPDDDRAFLMRCSILERLSGPLCNAILQADGAEAVLQRLSAANVFLSAIDEEGRWFRLHRLFAETLRLLLSREAPEEVRGLHARASEWFEENGDEDLAIEHAISAAETARAARLVWNQAGDLLASGDVAKLERWLDRFTSRQVVAHAKLALTAAWCSLYGGRPVSHWVNAAENGMYEAERPGESVSLTAATALLHAVLARNGFVQMIADARLAMSLQQPDDIWRCMAMFLEVSGTYLAGDATDARSRLEEVSEVASAYKAYHVSGATLAQLAMLAAEDNDWPAAEDLAQRARDLLREHDLDQVPMFLACHCMLALIAARNGQTEEAAALARRCSTTLAVTPQLPAWAAGPCRYELARTQMILGDTPAARVLLSEVPAGSPAANQPSGLRDLIEKTWHQIEKMSLGFEHGASSLTTAELRVLQYLPTHLSFEQIGEELFVSRNTVKTQAIAAYRKLGVTSRTEAVERAQALGLLQR